MTRSTNTGTVISEATSRKAINTICGQIRKAYEAADELVHRGLLLAIAHADAYRDVMPVAQVIDAMPVTSRRALAINWVHMATNIRLRKDGKSGMMKGNWLTAETQSVKDRNDFMFEDRRIVVKKDANGPIGIVVNPLTISETDEIIKELGVAYSYEEHVTKFPTWFSNANTGGGRGQEPGIFTLADADERVIGLAEFLRRKADKDPRVSDDDKRELKAYAREIEEVHNKYKAKAEAATKSKDAVHALRAEMVDNKAKPTVLSPVQEQSPQKMEGDDVVTKSTGTNG